MIADNKFKKKFQMGMRCSDTAIINFDNVRIPAENIIGDEGMGFTYQMMQVKISKLNWLSNVNDLECRFDVWHETFRYANLVCFS